MRVYELTLNNHKVIYLPKLAVPGAKIDTCMLLMTKIKCKLFTTKIKCKLLTTKIKCKLLTTKINCKLLTRRLGVNC